ncbi:hypothetical protein N7495_005157 [Penicillium taxi]|uniref:uncharacterized protein n=1 Tax=Penicillium taxi TaxID=168475 RepID=UPI0025459112|nr:uncharacterized protein N7495_005157 [Penicillium taxi]KAJ5893466.1 hypothetical protein N7495_005157 [Penicillium taxi]
MTHDLDPTTQNTKTSKDLLRQCVNILAELDELQALLKETLRNPQLVEVRQFRSNVNAELKMLQKLERQIQASVTMTAKDSDPDIQDSEVSLRLVHALRSSNLPFYQAVWDIVKGSCVGLLALGKRFYWESETNPKEVNESSLPGKQPSKDKRKSVYVDVVADDGEEWVKVSTISESRLLFEMAKKGWEGDDSDEMSEEEVILQNFHGENGEDDDEGELELIQLARDLRKAANSTRVRYRHPRVRIVLPKIEEGNFPEINEMIKEMRSFDIQVDCQNTLAVNSSTLDLTRLLPRPYKKFTSTLNVDCTLLLAIVSDLSHIKDIPVSPSFHKAIVRQIEVEREKPLLPSELWPAMGGNELVCTEEAAMRMREIVETIGSDKEMDRMNILMAYAPYDHLDRQALIKVFQELSDYDIPTEWKLPIRVIDAQAAISTDKVQGKLPPLADRVIEGLSDINYSVFIYGWVTGMTTISSNRTIDRQIEATIEKYRDGNEDLEGPPVWICDTARSLAGKDRNRKA